MGRGMIAVIPGALDRKATAMSKTQQPPLFSDAFLEIRDPTGGSRVEPLHKSQYRLALEDTPFKLSWRLGENSLKLQEHGLPENHHLKAGTRVLLAGFGLLFETVSSVARYLTEPLSGPTLHALEFADRHLTPCADRARALAQAYQSAELPNRAAAFFEKALFCSNSDSTHFLAALSTFSQWNDGAWLERLLELAHSRFPRARAIEHWERSYREQQRRYHHLTALQNRSLLTSLSPDAVHEYRLPPFCLSFPGDTPPPLVDFCLKTLERAHGQLKGLGRFPQRVQVNLDVWRAGSHELAMAYFDGKAIYVNRDYFLQGNRNEQLQATLKHELIHAVNFHTARFLDLPLPKWIDEGLAYFLTEGSRAAACPADWQEILRQPDHPHYEAACCQAAVRVERFFGETPLYPDGIEKILRHQLYAGE